MLSCILLLCFFFFFSSRRLHTRCSRDWSSDVCSSDLSGAPLPCDTPAGWTRVVGLWVQAQAVRHSGAGARSRMHQSRRSEEHTSELQSRLHLVCRLLLEKKKVNLLKELHNDVY